MKSGYAHLTVSIIWLISKTTEKKTQLAFKKFTEASGTIVLEQLIHLKLKGSQIRT